MNQHHHHHHHHSTTYSQTDSTKPQSLQNLTPTLNSSLSNLLSSTSSSSSLNLLSQNPNPELQALISDISLTSHSLLHCLSTSTSLWEKHAPFPYDLDDDEAFNCLVDINDEVLRQFDECLGLKFESLEERREREKEKAKVPFHVASIRKPQEEYKIKVNNSNRPFQHVWLEKSEEGKRFIHPLEKLSVLDFVDKDIDNLVPLKPPPVESTPLKFVEDVKELKALAAKLRGVDEFAVDLEHNHYRSFQGLTCLMQISTRTEDFIVDVLKLRNFIGPHLRDAFRDPTKKKVMHGADRDILWLQRDFGIYVCNMFDTGQSSRVLKLERNSLAHLLQHYCGVTANKQYQSSDWRLRPLPYEMIRYAREDTHYLLYIYDVMRTQLCAVSENSDAALTEVYKRSYDICIQLYEKEILTDTTYLHIYGLQGAGFNAKQLAVVAGLYEWRDTMARTEDEGTGYILSNKTLFEIAKQMPVTSGKLQRLVKPKHPYVEGNLDSVVRIIRYAIQNSDAFEAAVELLKEKRLAALSKESSSANEEPEFVPPDTTTEVAETGSSTTSPQLPAQPSTALQLPRKKSFKLRDIAHYGMVVIPKHPVENNLAKTDSNGHSVKISEDANANANLSKRNSRDLNASASVQLQKKVCGAFGELPQNSGSKRKPDLNGKVKEEIQMAEIKSLMNLAFPWLEGRKVQSGVNGKDATGTLDSRKLVELQAAGSKKGDIIILDDDPDSDIEELT